MNRVSEPAHERNHSGGEDDRLTVFLMDPPEWFVNQATHCANAGIPERLLKPLASTVSFSVLNDPRRADEVKPEIERWIKRR